MIGRNTEKIHMIKKNPIAKLTVLNSNPYTKQKLVQCFLGDL